MKNFKAQLLIDLVDKFSGPLKSGPMRRLSELQRQTQAVDRGMENLFSGGAVTAGAAAFAAPLIAGTAAAIRYESAMADVKRVTDFKPRGFRQMSNDVLLLSLRIPMAATELAQLVEAAGQSKLYRTRQEMLRFAQDSGMMATAFKMSAADAGGAMTGFRTIFRLNQNEVVLLGDAYNYLGNNMDARASDIVNIANRVGATAKLFGLSGQQAGALGASFLALKTPPEVAATGVNALLNRLATAPQQTARFQGGLAKLGLEATDLKRRIGTDAQGALLDFLQRVRGSGDALGILTDLFGAEYSDDIAKLVGSLNVYERALGLVGSQSRYAGSMTAEYRAQTLTTQNALILLRNNVTALGVAFTTFFLPVIQLAGQAVGFLIEPIIRLIQANPLLARVLALTTGAAILLAGAAGLGIVAVAGFTLALTQARIGLAAYAGVSGVAATQQGLLSLAVAGTRTRLVAATVAARAFYTSMLASATLRIAALRAMGLSGALAAVRVGFMNATRAAWAFAAPILANPVFWLIAALIALGAGFVYAWRKSEDFRAGVMRGLEPISRAWAGLKEDVASLGRIFAPLGATWQRVTRRMGLDLDAVKRPLDALRYGFGFFIGFVGTSVAIVFGRAISFLITGFGGLVQIVEGLTTAAIGLATLDFSKMMAGLDKASGGLQQLLLSPLELAGVDSKQFRKDLRGAEGFGRSWQRRVGNWLGVPASVPAPDTQPFAFGLNTAMWVAEGWGVATRTWVGQKFQTAAANTTTFLDSLTGAEGKGKSVWGRIGGWLGVSAQTAAPNTQPFAFGLNTMLEQTSGWGFATRTWIGERFQTAAANTSNLLGSIRGAGDEGKSVWQSLLDNVTTPFDLPRVNRRNLTASLEGARAAGAGLWETVKAQFPGFGLPWIGHATFKRSLNEANSQGTPIWQSTLDFLAAPFALGGGRRANFDRSLADAKGSGETKWGSVTGLLKTAITLPGVNASAIQTSLQGVLDTITGFGPQMLEAGASLIGNLIDGFKSRIGELTGFLDKLKFPWQRDKAGGGGASGGRATETAERATNPAQIANRTATPTALQPLVQPNVAFDPAKFLPLVNLDPARGYGQLLAQGFAQGILSEQQVVRFAAQRMGGEAEAALRQRLRIQSPSRVFAGLGGMVTQGLGQGILSRRSLVTGAMRTLAAAAVAVPITPQLGVPALDGPLIPPPSAIGRAAAEPSREERTRGAVGAAGQTVKHFNFPNAKFELNMADFKTKDEFLEGLSWLFDAFGEGEE